MRANGVNDPPSIRDGSWSRITTHEPGTLPCIICPPSSPSSTPTAVLRGESSMDEKQCLLDEPVRPPWRDLSVKPAVTYMVLPQAGLTEPRVAGRKEGREKDWNIPTSGAASAEGLVQLWLQGLVKRYPSCHTENWARGCLCCGRMLGVG